MLHFNEFFGVRTNAENAEKVLKMQEKRGNRGKTCGKNADSAKFFADTFHCRHGRFTTSSRETKIPTPIAHTVR